MNRTLPHNQGAEASVLGGVMLRRSTLDLASVAALGVDDFYNPKHQAVFMAMRNLEAQAKPIDPVTVEAELARLGKSESVGGLAFLGELALLVPSAENVDAYATIVGKLSTRRKVITALAESMDRLYSADDDDEDLNGEAGKAYAMAKLSAVETRSSASARTIGAVVKDRVAQLDRLFAARERGESALTGIPTGVVALDDRIGGYQPGIVTLVAGRPGMGKSSVLMAGCFAATAAGYGAHVFPFEDSDESLADRAMASASDVPATSIRSLQINRAEFGRLGSAMNLIASRKNWIMEKNPSPYVDDIIAAVRRDAASNGTRIAVIDYIQLLRGPRSRKYRASDREQELSDIGTELMLAARADGIAYVVGAQLNRDCERREDKRPAAPDLRGSGTLEERAKTIIMVYRGSHYGPAVIGTDEQTVNARGIRCDPYVPDGEEWSAVMELLVEKNSNGQTGRVRATWDGPTMRVS